MQIIWHSNLIHYIQILHTLWQVHMGDTLVAAAHMMLRHSHWERLPLPVSVVYPPNVTLALHCVRCEGNTKPIMVFNKKGRLQKRRPILMAKTGWTKLTWIEYEIYLDFILTSAKSHIKSKQAHNRGLE